MTANLYLTCFLSGLLFCSCSSDKKNRNADALFNEGEYTRAIQVYDQQLNKNPDDYMTQYNRARAYEELGQHKKALGEYKEISKEHPEFFPAKMGEARYYFNQGDYETAAYTLENGIKKGDKDENAFFLYARANHKAGKTKKALNAYDKAIEKNRDFGLAYLYRGALKIYLERKREGCSDLKIAASLEVDEAQPAIEEYCQ